MARKQLRKASGAGKPGQSETKTRGGQGPVGLERGREIGPVQSQESKPIAAPTPTLVHDRIVERAKQLWQDRGCPQGQDEFIWHEAERQLKRESGME